LLRDKENNVRSAAASALGSIGRDAKIGSQVKTIIPPLIELLQEKGFTQGDCAILGNLV